MKMEMFLPIDNDEVVTEERHLEKRRENIQERIQINLVFTKMLIVPLVTFLLLV
jgi:hypothetical protein